MVPLFPPPMMTRPWLAKDAVHFVGEPIVAIVAETQAQGADAAEAVFVDYEPTEAIVDLEAAAEPGATLVHPEVGTNVGVDFVQFQMMKGVTDDTFFDGCDVVVRQRIINNRVAAAPLEGRSAAASWDGDKLTFGKTTYTKEKPQASPPPEPPARFKGLIGEYGWDHLPLYIYEQGGKLYALIELTEIELG